MHSTFFYIIFSSEIEFLWEFYSNCILILGKETWGKAKRYFHLKLKSSLTEEQQEQNTEERKKIFPWNQVLSQTSQKQNSPMTWLSRNRQRESACFIYELSLKRNEFLWQARRITICHKIILTTLFFIQFVRLNHSFCSGFTVSFRFLLMLFAKNVPVCFCILLLYLYSVYRTSSVTYFCG